MKKQLILSAAVFGLACASVFAQGIDPVAMDRIDTIVQGKNNGDQIIDLRVQDDGLVKGDLGVGGTLVVSNGISSPVASSLTGLKVNGQFGLSQSSLTVTTGQIIVFSTSPVIKMTAGGADLTVTATIAAVSATYVSNLYRVVNVGASNGIVITDTAPVYNSGATLGITDYATYNVIATNQIIQESTSNN